MPGCAAVGCNNRSEKGYMMKCFPRDPVLRQVWKERVGRTDWEPSNNAFLCDMHFESTEWIVTTNGRVKLKKGAVPSIFAITSTRKSSKKRGRSESETGDESAKAEFSSLDTSSEYNAEKSVNIKNEIKNKVFESEYNQLEKNLQLVCDGNKYDDLIQQQDLTQSRNSIENKNSIENRNLLENQHLNSEDLNQGSNSKNFGTIFDPADNEKQKKFVIKISGVPDDVYEITENLNFSDIEPMKLEFNGNKFVTSEITLNCPKLTDHLISSGDEEEGTEFEDDSVNNPSFVVKLLHNYRDLQMKADLQEEMIKILLKETNNGEFLDKVESIKNKRRNCNSRSKSCDQSSDLDKCRISQLEGTNKELIKSLQSTVDKNRTLEYMVKDRENQIKEMNRKLDKASKVFERAQKNANTYRRKLATMQTYMRRKSIQIGREQTYDMLTVESAEGDFSKKSLETARSLVASFGYEGYLKLLKHNFPLPPIEMLQNENSSLDNIEENLENNTENNSCEFESGTVQDIFNESSDEEDAMDINEIRKYITIDDNNFS